MQELLTGNAAVPARAAALPARRKRGRPRDDGADERILDAAARLLMERGFDSMTLDDVAASARAGKATVYRRWTSKEDLAMAALGRLYQRELVVPDTGSIRGDLQAFLAHALDFVGKPSGRAYYKTALAESLRDERIAEMHAGAHASREAAVHAMFQRGIDRGEVRPDARIDYAMRWLAGLLSTHIVLAEPTPVHADIADMIDFLLNGIGAAG